MTLRSQINADLTTLYKTSSGFAEIATSDINSIPGHYFEDFEQTELSDYAAVDNTNPIFRILESDESKIVNNLLTVRGVDFEVIQKRPNGEGEIDLKLHKV